MHAIFLDLDGTLLDTLGDIHENLNKALMQFGYPCIDLEHTRAYIGHGARELVAQALPAGSQDVDACADYFRAHYGTCANAHTKPYEGASEFLARARAAGLKLAVITNKSQDATERAVLQFFPNVFDFVAGNSGAFPCKPDPSLTRYAALTMRVAPRDCVFVGDGETDVLTARNAGMRGIAALWGYRSRAQLEAAGAKVFAESFHALGDLIFG